MWVFPKEDHLSIGVWARLPGYTNRLREFLSDYLDSLELGDYEQRLTRGHRLLLRRSGAPIQTGNALLVGDAAGLIEFWTGEGIYYAIRSAQLAAQPVVDFLEGKAPGLQPYEVDIDRELIPELHIARTMGRIGVWFPRLAYTLMKRSDHAWDLASRILRAEKSYHDVPRMWGPFSFLFDFMGAGT